MVNKRSKPYQYPNHSEATGKQESLRQVKMEVEQLQKKLQSSLLENPRVAKKAALLISLWIEGKEKKRTKK